MAKELQTAPPAAYFGPEDYRAFVLRVWRHGGAPASAEARLHALAMLVSESQEFLLDPTRAEAGDVCWATEALAAAYGLPPLQVRAGVSLSRAALNWYVAKAAKACQKIAQGAEPAAWLPTLAEALECARDVALGQSGQTVLRANVSKLETRYNGPEYNAAADAGRINKTEA